VRRLNIGSPDANTRIDIPANAKRGSKAAPISPVALEAVKRIETLFDIEREINGLAAKQCLERRRKDSLPLVGGRSPTIYLIRKSGCQYEDNRQSGFHVHWREGVQPKIRRTPLPQQGGDTFLYGDVNGDGKAGFSVRFDNSIKFQSSDFLL
jgi:hypothetical protein